MNKENNSSQVENSKLETRLQANNSNSSNIKNSKLEPREPSSKVNLRRAAAVVVPPVVPPVNQGDLANVVKELEYLTSLGLTRNSDNEAMKTALRRYKELTRSEYAFPTTRPELAKVRKDLEYLTSLGLTRNSDNEAMKKALIEYRSLTGNEYDFPIITTVAGTGTSDLIGDGGAATNASLNSPSGVAVDGGGNLFIADRYNNRIRRVAAGTGIITTVAGNGVLGISGNGIPATSARLSHPHGVAVDGGGNLYIADNFNHRIRRVDASGVITTVAGTGTWGFSGDGGPGTSAILAGPIGVAMDGSGNLLIADMGNNRIRRLAAGIITTVAGNGAGGSGGDGGDAKRASLNPTGVAVDGGGNLYIADYGNHRIRRVDAGTGVITTVAGTGTAGFGGDGGPATSASLNNPYGVAVDGGGNVLIADCGNHRIRRVDASGVIMTVAGTGVEGFSGDGGPGTSARLWYPGGMAMDGAGNLYIADSNNNRIRKVNNILAAPAAPRSGGRKNRVKKSRVLKKSRRVKKSKRINR